MSVLASIKSDVPLCVLDVESTGTDPAEDRIIQVGLLRFDEFEGETRKCWLVNPGRMIPAKVTELTKITNEKVATAPCFEAIAEELLSVMDGCALVGYNLLNFDVPILWEEFYRANIDWNLDGIHIIDAGNIFKKKEKRDLSSALKKYAGREHVGAHDALADAVATAEVLVGQLQTYADLTHLDAGRLAEFSRMDELDGVPVQRVDLAGIIVRDGQGIVRFTHKKVRGIALRDDVGYAEWILRSNFSANTKAAIRRALSELEPQHDLFP